MNVQARAIGPAKNEYSFREGESTIVLLSKKESTIVSVILVAHVFFSTDLYFVSASVPTYPECFKVARLSAGLPSLID